MRHPDFAELVELALAQGEDSESPLAGHLGHCPRCRAELGELRRVVVAARSVSPDDLLAPPPDRVWEGISAQLARDAMPGEPGDAALHEAATAAADELREPEDMTDGQVPPEETPPAEGSTAEAHEERRDGGIWEHPGFWIWLIVAGAVLIAAFFVVRMIAL